MTTKSRSRFQIFALVGIVALLVAFGVQQLGGLTFEMAGDDPETPVEVTALGGDVLFDQTVTVGSGAPVVLDLSSEDVVIEQGVAGEVRVVVEGSTEAARDFFADQNYEVESEDDGATLRARPDRRAERRRTYRDGETPTVHVWLPAGSAVTYEGTSGDVRIDKLEAASLTLDTGSGDIALGEIGAETATLDTGSGDVAVERLDVSTARIDTGSGDVSVQASSGVVEVDTGSGDVAVGAHDGAFTADTGSGDVVAHIVGARMTEVDTGSGDVALTLGTPNGVLDVETNGDVTIASSLDFDGRNRDGTARGRLGAGGPPVTVESGSGDVSIRDGR